MQTKGRPRFIIPAGDRRHCRLSLAFLGSLFRAAEVDAQTRDPDRLAPLAPVAGSDRCRLESPARIVVQDSTTWIWLWAHACGRTPRPPIDFYRETVIVASLGATPTTGYSITIDSAVRITGQRARVFTTVFTAGCNCTVGKEATYPIDMRRVATSEYVFGFEFRDRDEYGDR